MGSTRNVKGRLMGVIISTVNGIEVEPAAKMRFPICAYNSVFGLMAVIFCIIGVCGLSTAESTVKNVPWITFKAAGPTGPKFYMNLMAVTYKDLFGNKQTTKIMDLGNIGDCRWAVSSVGGNAVVVLFLTFFAFLAAVARTMMPDQDSMTKFGAVVMSFLAIIFNLAVVGQFADKCYKSGIPSEWDAKFDIGFASFVITLVFVNVPGFITNLILPVYSEGGKMMDETDMEVGAM